MILGLMLLGHSSSAQWKKYKVGQLQMETCRCPFGATVPLVNGRDTILTVFQYPVPTGDTVLFNKDWGIFTVDRVHLSGYVVIWKWPASTPGRGGREVWKITNPIKE